MLSGSASAPGRSTGPVTVPWIKAHIDKLQELAEVVITDIPPWTTPPQKMTSSGQ